MGVRDEHWCSRCHRYIHKETDAYTEINAVNDPGAIGRETAGAEEAPKKKGRKKAKTALSGEVVRFSSGLLCKECAEKIHVDYPDPKTGKTLKITFWEFQQRARERGNPNFRAFVSCVPFDPEKAVEGFVSSEGVASKVCETWGAPTDAGRNCEHLVVDTRGFLYCKRRHPGRLEIHQEQTVVDAQKMEMLGDFLFKIVGEMPDAQKALLGLGAMPGFNDKDYIDPNPLRTGADIGQPPPKTMREKIQEAVIEAQKRALERKAKIPAGDFRPVSEAWPIPSPPLSHHDLRAPFEARDEKPRMDGPKKRI